MKKIFYFASAAALIFSSCAKDATEDVAVTTTGSILSASYATDGEDTRTTLDGNIYKWAKGDAIGVFDESTQSADNVAFTLRNEDDGKTNGTFVSPDYQLLAGTKYFAYYPYKPGQGTYGVTEGPEGMSLQVLGSQNYTDGSFTTLSAPAVGADITVEEKDGLGYATVVMQPVVDYLKWKVNAVAPIEKLRLELYNAEGNINISGYGQVTAYTYKVNGKETTGYYLARPTEGQYWITLKCGKKTDVSCHEEHTYVFVIPGGIIGQEKVTAKIFVNDDLEATNVREFAASKTASTDQRANTMYTYNEKDTKTGEFITATYNPNNAYRVITNEIELLEYIQDYNAGKAKADDGTTVQNAFLCNNGGINEDGVYDFSTATFDAYATEIGQQNPIISDYIANGFTAFTQSFTASFVGEKDVTLKGFTLLESKGNTSFFNTLGANAVIKNISFEDVTVTADKKNSTATTSVVSSNVHQNATIENINVTNCTADNVFNKAYADKVNVVTVKKGEGAVKNLVGTLYLDDDLEIDDVADFEVTGALLATIHPVTNAKVVTVNTACEFNDLTGSAAPLADGTCCAVVIDGTSYWTGGVSNAFGNAVDKTAKVMPVEYAEELAYYANNGYTNATYPLQLANDMDMNGDQTTVSNMQTVFNEAVYNWKSVKAITSLDGNEKTISNIHMVAVKNTSGKMKDVAPFYAKNISDLTIEGVTIDIPTNSTHFVPERVAGVTFLSTNGAISKVKATDINIVATYEGTDKQGVKYTADMQPRVGLLVAEGKDVYIHNCEVEGYANIKGYVGSLVGYAQLADTREFQVYNNTASLTWDQVNNTTGTVAQLTSGKLTAITATSSSYYNTTYKGNLVGVICNTSETVARSIRFKGLANETDYECFYEDFEDHGAINVVIDDATKVTMAAK